MNIFRFNQNYLSIEYFQIAEIDWPLPDFSPNNVLLVVVPDNKNFSGVNPTVITQHSAISALSLGDDGMVQSSCIQQMEG